MKINLIKYKLITVALLLLSMLMMSCDQIEGPYRQSNVDTTNNTDKYVRNVLLEEYTGFRCGNCPRAARLAANLKESFFKDRLILLGIHAGGLATPKGIHKYDFRTTTGNDLDKLFAGSDQMPVALLNRVGYPNEFKFFENSWETKIREIMDVKPKMMIELAPSFNASTKEITVKANINYLTDGSPNDYISLYIAEDSIVQYQQDDQAVPPEQDNYVHMHVLRGAVNNSWGEQLSSTGATKGQKITREFKYTIPDGKDWKPNNINIIGFVYDYNNTYEIWQAAESKLIK